MAEYYEYTRRVPLCRYLKNQWVAIANPGDDHATHLLHEDSFRENVKLTNLYLFGKACEHRWRQEVARAARLGYRSANIMLVYPRRPIGLRIPQLPPVQQQVEPQLQQEQPWEQPAPVVVAQNRWRHLDEDVSVLEDDDDDNNQQQVFGNVDNQPIQDNQF